MSLTISCTVDIGGGVDIPRLGLGVYQTQPGVSTRRAVAAALDCGYRHIDTAALYANEADVGTAIRESGIPRANIFVTTKLWNIDHGYGSALSAFDESLATLGIEYIDLYLIHWPVHGLRGESWRALEDILADGRCRAIGVSNYTIRHLDQLLSTCRVPPAVNQVEFSPFLFQKDLLTYSEQKGIRLESYSPLTKGQRFSDTTVSAIALHHKKSPAQVMIRWALQHDIVVIPKSAHAGRIAENADVFDFALSEDDMARLNGLDENFRTSWDPTGEP